MRNFFRTIFINVIIFLIGIATLEFFFGDWWLDNRLFLTRIPRSVQLSFADTDLYVDFSGSQYTRDKYGLRGDYSELNQIDILTVGGSTTDQRYIDDNLTWQERLREYLERETGTSYSIVNAGVDGQSTYGHIENFEHWFSFMPKLKANYILYYVGLNDKWEGLVPVGGDYVSPVVASKKSDEREQLLFLLHKSAFYNAWINAVGYIRKDGFMGHRKTNWNEETWVKSSDESDKWKNDWPYLEAYQERLSRLIDMTHAWGAEVIIVNQKSLHSRYNGNVFEVLIPESWTEEKAVRIVRLEQVYATSTIALCKRKGAICIDLYGDLKYRLKEQHFYDFDHNNPEGTELIGKYLGQQLLPLFSGQVSQKR